MPSYRFCRSDDVPLLVRAYNDCFRVHFADLAPMTEASFKQRVREIDLWTSSSMVAAAAREPIAVLLAAKREQASLIHALGVRPGHRRRGHARHLLASLSAKLAILGPPRILAEVPAEQTAARGLLEACGFRAEHEWGDWVLRAPPRATGGPPEVVVPASVDELDAAGALEGPHDALPWERWPRSLRARRAELAGLAVASPERIEAWLLWHDTDASRAIVGLGCADPARRQLWLGLLLRQAAASARGAVCLPRLGAGEVDAALLRAVGWQSAGRHVGYAARARPA